MTDKNDSNAAGQQKEGQQQHIVLFYKYHPLSNEKDTTEVYRSALETLCSALSLKGRILVAHSESEGINGTLAGDYHDVKAFTYALLGEKKLESLLCLEENNAREDNEKRREILEAFWKASKNFFESIGKPILELNTPEDFKWSRVATSSSSSSLFPDLNIKLVKELIGTGGVLSNIPIEETAKGYLTPLQWHDELAKLSIRSTAEEDGHTTEADVILIDCRNTKECEIGHFEHAIDPLTTNFSQFPKWVDEHRHMLENKRVLMYCTGGIRCEKASAYVRRQIPSVKNVQHLKGGIHKYLEAVDDKNSHWLGRNFVFHADVETKLGCDGGGENDKASETAKGAATHTQTIVGKCIYCQAPYDNFDPRCVCTVCREPTLSCQGCQQKISEFHCKQHQHLRSCYFTDLSVYTTVELTQQLDELESIIIKVAVGKRFKQKRKTLQKQCDKIRQRVAELEGGGSEAQAGENTQRCRNCDDPNCSGRCWGFYSLKRKEILEKKQQANDLSAVNAGSESKENGSGIQGKKRSSKQINRDRVNREIEHLKLSLPPSSHRDPVTGIRVPPPCTRVLQTNMKGKWKGMPVLKVVQDEFMELSKPGVLERVIDNGLLHVNGNPVSMDNAGAGMLSGDTISRVVHWHEPPVVVPHRIGVERVRLPHIVLTEFGIPTDTDDIDIYVCNKPSTVPVHPAGPYLSNSMTMMVEAQECLPPQSLFPCHRTDRVTSGLTICCTNTNVARIVQRSMCEHQVQKLYLARVQGKFPASNNDFSSLVIGANVADLAEVKYSEQTKCIRVDAPIETVDPANGIRQVTEKGKPSSSLFQLVSYDSGLDVSLLACRPITGRSHQLRVHLQLTGFPIVNDVLYGGKVLSAPSQREAAIQALLQSTTKPEQELKVISIADTDATSAREACSLCSSLDKEFSATAAKKFYTAAQLLDGGHSIDLHAFQYRIDFLPKGKKDDIDIGAKEQKAIGKLELRVDNPDWADEAATENVRWLEEDP